MSLSNDPSLRQKLASLPGAEDSPPSSSSERNHGPFLEFRPGAQKRVGFPWAQLCHYTLEPLADSDTPERLTLAFSTADVVIVGARLGKLVDAIQAHKLAWIAAVDARYAGLLTCGPWVANIVIARLDKAGSAAA